LLGLFFNYEGGGNMFLWNVGWLSMDYMVLYPIKQNSSWEYCHDLVCVTIRWGLHWMIALTDTLYTLGTTGNYSLSLIYTLSSSLLHTYNSVLRLL
jgi:hypothetical protein